MQILKLAGSTCQHFIPGVESLPVLGGLSKEMTQETFNCISASVILLIDECFDVVSRDKDELEKLGGRIFDLLLHLLATPQSSVTHLRTLGGKYSSWLLSKASIAHFLTCFSFPTRHCARP